jgi:hypothetical protein
MTTTTDTKTCITYQLAYLHGQVTLCADHDDCARFGALGAVSHGRHEDHCDECLARAQEEAAAESGDIECAYCGLDVPSHHNEPVSGIDWEEEAEHHADDCEWVSTRAHTIE